MSLNVQFYLLIHTILYGIFLGICFDTLETVSTLINKKIYRSGLLILHWVVQIPTIIIFFHRVNHGVLQSYLIVFIFLGSWLYFKTCRQQYTKNLKTLLKVGDQTHKTIKKVLNILIFKPIVFIFARIFDIMTIPKKFFRKKTIKQQDHEEFKQSDEAQCN